MAYQYDNNKKTYQEINLPPHPTPQKQLSPTVTFSSSSNLPVSIQVARATLSLLV